MARKKGIKPVVQRMNQQVISTREASRKAQDERRKAQRRLARVLTEETGEKVSWKNAYQIQKDLNVNSSEAKSLAKTIESLTSVSEKEGGRKKGYGVQIERAAESIETYTMYRFGGETLSRKGLPIEQKRKNEMFTHQINQSTKKEGLSILDKKETHGFYAATQWIWESSRNNENRNEAIMNEFGLTDLEQVYNLITNEELNYEDFGFEDEEMFEDWLDEIRTRIDIDELREIFNEEMTADNESGSDDSMSPSGGEAIKNIRMRTEHFKRRKVS